MKTDASLLLRELQKRLDAEIQRLDRRLDRMDARIDRALFSGRIATMGHDDD